MSLKQHVMEKLIGIREVIRGVEDELRKEPNAQKLRELGASLETAERLLYHVNVCLGNEYNRRMSETGEGDYAPCVPMDIR